MQANRYFSRNVPGKVASLVQETALCEYGKMVNKTDHTFETLRSGEAPSWSSFFMHDSLYNCTRKWHILIIANTILLLLTIFLHRFMTSYPGDCLLKRTHICMFFAVAIETCVCLCFRQRLP